MAKLKVKKEMTLAGLIQWGWDNKIKNREFYSENGKKAIFNSNGNFKPKVYFKPEDTFTVEIEEEIDEHTKIPVLVGMYKRDKNTYYSIIKHNTSIISEKDKTPVAFYMLNDDMTMTLIWRNGGMVE